MFHTLSPSDRIPGLLFSTSFNILKNPSTWSKLSLLNYDLSFSSDFVKVISRCLALNARIASSEGTPPFHLGRPSEAICDIKDFDVSFPTANPLFPAKISRTVNIDSSSFVDTVHAPLLYAEGHSIFSTVTSLLLRRHLPSLLSVDLSTFGNLGDISQRPFFPS